MTRQKYQDLDIENKKLISGKKNSATRLLFKNVHFDGIVCIGEERSNKHVYDGPFKNFFMSLYLTPLNVLKFYTFQIRFQNQ